MLANAYYDKALTITKSDTVNIDGSTYVVTNAASPCEAIYVGGAGVVVVVFQDGSTASFTCIAGQILPVRAIRVNASNTTATLMLALYGV